MGKRKRIPTRIRPNKKKEFPRELFFFDVESKLKPIDRNTTEHLFWLASWIYVRLNDRAEVAKEERGIAKTTEELHQAILSHLKRKKCLRVISANIGYDVIVSKIPQMLAKEGFENTFLYTEGLTTIMRWKKGDISLEFLNVQNWFRGNVKELGEMIGLHKLEIDLEKANEEEVITYCMRDTEIIKEAIIRHIKFIREMDWGNWGRTLAKQAQNIYRHRYMRHDIYIHCNEEVIALERKAYRGGMVRVFRRGIFQEGPYYKLDVNSMYPYVMLINEYPSRLIRVVKEPDLEYLSKMLKVNCVIADVIINPGEACFPCNVGGRNIYPCFRFRTCLCSRGLEYALEHEWIEKVFIAAIYRKEPLFRSYVKALYPLKEKYTVEGDKIRRQFVKDLLNSLYGAWGKYSKSFIRAPEYDSWNHEWGLEIDLVAKSVSPIYYFGFMAFKLEIEGETWDSFPAIAAHVTEDARLYLWKLIKRAGIEHVFYCDTDSLIVDQVGYHELEDMIDPKELGKLKVEEVTSVLVINARKDYKTDSHQVLKGKPKGAIDLTEDSFEYEEWLSLRGWMEKGPNAPYVTIKRQKKLARQVFDGLEQEDGRIIPFNSPSQIWWTKVNDLTDEPH
jgi:hypothetical protein